MSDESNIEVDAVTVVELVAGRAFHTPPGMNTSGNYDAIGFVPLGNGGF